jgi:HAD superfamily hydrolase (TIGR01450 family)
MLWGRYDSLILDLDGVVYIGQEAVEHAIESLNAISDSVRITAATNNASRHHSEVAEHLRHLGLRISDGAVITSADAGASYLSNLDLSSDRILVVGGEGLARTVSEQGFEVLRATKSHAENNEIAHECAAIIQGHGTDTSWWDITTALWAVKAGKPWIATNRDMSVPLPYGTSIGNGGFVSLLEGFSGVTPVVTGKPELHLFQTLINRLNLHSPIVIGDSFQTDIQGAHNASLDSLLVLTGVSTMKTLSAERLKPTYIAHDLRALLEQNPPRELG